jgi:hypothetical protein
VLTLTSVFHLNSRDTSLILCLGFILYLLLPILLLLVPPHIPVSIRCCQSSTIAHLPSSTLVSRRSQSNLLPSLILIYLYYNWVST